MKLNLEEAKMLQVGTSFEYNLGGSKWTPYQVVKVASADYERPFIFLHVVRCKKDGTPRKNARVKLFSITKHCQVKVLKGVDAQ